MGTDSVAADLIVGTAGHIDHGKTSLVRTLTGVDLDALPEERARGITIALGFTALDLPDGRRAALIDVPGHERLVRTMIGGAHGIDAVMLCVSAVDGVMPQTREHLAILGLLGVRQGLVVLTMADLVDEEMLELATDDVVDTLEGTFLEGATLVPFSAVDGRGTDEVVAAIAAFAAREHTVGGPFRLPVDRAFVRQGFGTVVTGTSQSGRLRDGEIVRLLPAERTARIRGIEVHGGPVPEVGAGARVALNLAGVEQSEVPRGTVVARGKVALSQVMDVRYTHVSTEVALEDGVAVRVLVGTAELGARFWFAEERDLIEEGETAWVQLRLESPAPCMAGDRLIVRRPSPADTLGGGVIVDPWAPKLRKKQRPQWAAELTRLQAGEVGVWLERAGEQGLHHVEWEARCPGSEVGVRLGDRVMAASLRARLDGALLAALVAFHAESPLSLGAHRRELHRGRVGHLPEKVFDALLERLADKGAIVVRGPLARLASFEVALTARQEAMREAVMVSIRGGGIAGIPTIEVHEAHPEPEVEALVRLLEADGRVVSVAHVGWLAADVLQELRGQLRQWFDAQPSLSPAQFKDLTGLTRKHAIPLFEWVDKHRWTTRTPDGRLRGDDL